MTEPEDLSRDRIHSLEGGAFEDELLFQQRRFSSNGLLDMSVIIDEVFNDGDATNSTKTEKSVASNIDSNKTKQTVTRSGRVVKNDRKRIAEDISGSVDKEPNLSKKKKKREGKGRISHVFSIGGENYEVKTSGSRGICAPNKWTEEEDQNLATAVSRFGEKNWKAIADLVHGRNHVQCLQRWKKVLRPGLRKGHWTLEEDAKLCELVEMGIRHWGQVSNNIPGRVAKQCRERWCNHLDPDIKKGNWESAEDTIIMEMHKQLGNKWAAIGKMLPGRTENAVKIRWKSLNRTRTRKLKARAIVKSANQAQLKTTKQVTGSRKSSRLDKVSKKAATTTSSTSNASSTATNPVSAYPVMTTHTSDVIKHIQPAFPPDNYSKTSINAIDSPVTKRRKSIQELASYFNIATNAGTSQDIVDFSSIFTSDIPASDVNMAENPDLNLNSISRPPALSFDFFSTSFGNPSSGGGRHNSLSMGLSTDDNITQTGRPPAHSFDFNAIAGSRNGTFDGIGNYIEELDNNLQLDDALGSILSLNAVEKKNDIFALHRADDLMNISNPSTSTTSLNIAASDSATRNKE